MRQDKLAFTLSLSYSLLSELIREISCKLILGYVILRGCPNISGVTGRGSRIEISNDESREFSRYRRLDTYIYIE